MSRKNILNSPHLSELRKEKRKILFRKVLYLAIFLLVIFIALGLVSRLERLNINDIEVEGNIVVDTEVIKKVVEEAISGNYLWLFPKTSFLLYPKGGIKNKLEDEFKILKDISVKIENTNNLKISVSEREPAYTWCGESLELGATAEEGACYFMDENGYVFSIAPYFSGDVYFKFFSPQNEKVLGSYVLPDIFNHIVAFLETLRDMELKPISILSKDDGKLEVFLASISLPPNAPKIILNKDFEVEKTAENLQAALATEPLQSDFKKKYNSLLYIDLSFGNRVYFKFND
ncbi:hypothetical protein K8Q98_03015 [Candidatus Nomurabacteria bacterium]|nr:hypothetical protein [Candidatus Nomurabacteria bacterium]